MSKKVSLLPLIALIFLSLTTACNTSSTSSGINVVAAENFYGDIAKQIGGSHISVTSILSNPNVDPHEYEASIQNSQRPGHRSLYHQLPQKTRSTRRSSLRTQRSAL